MVPYNLRKLSKKTYLNPFGYSFQNDGIGARLNNLSNDRVGGVVPAEKAAWLQTFAAFRHTNFRLYFVGLLVSIIGTWSQSAAQNWLVYQLTSSSLALGQVSFASAIPIWLFGPWAGVLIDRASRKNLLLLTQVIMTIQAFVLAGLTFSGQIRIWHIILLSGILGLATALDAPTRQSFLVEMVGKEDLSNAIALNSTMFSLARTIGPTIGSLVVAWLGTAWAFTINGVSFFGILASLLLIRLPQATKPRLPQSPITDLIEGLKFIWQEKTINALMILSLTVSLFGSSFTTLMPVIARDVLHQDVIAYGVLYTAAGAGSIIGALMAAYFSIRPRRGRLLNFFNIALPITLLLFSFSRLYAFSLVLLVAVGIAYVPQLSTCNMLIQSNVSDHVRGRVMSVFSLVVFGAVPIGGLLAGWLADVIGAPWSIGLCALAMLAVGLLLRIFVPKLTELD
jgi:MFS family permease